MPNVLVMTTFEGGSPVTFSVFLKTSDLSLHRRFSAGFHQINIDSAISQQTAEDMISGVNC